MNFDWAAAGRQASRAGRQQPQEEPKNDRQARIWLALALALALATGHAGGPLGSGWHRGRVECVSFQGRLTQWSFPFGFSRPPATVPCQVRTDHPPFLLVLVLVLIPGGAVHSSSRIFICCGFISLVGM